MNKRDHRRINLLNKLVEYNVPEDVIRDLEDIISDLIKDIS